MNNPSGLGRAVRFLARVSGPFAGMVAIACSPTPGGEDDVGVARVALSQAPTDVRCLEITARGVRQVVIRFDVAPGTSPTFEMAGLPLGEVQFSANAFQDVCATLASTSMPTPTWVGDAAIATIVRGVVAQVTLVMRRNGRASIAIDFQDCGDGLTDLGSIRGAGDISPADMNELGQVTGSAGVGSSGIGAFLWDTGTLTPLELEAGTVVAINNRGQIIGRDGGGRNVLWDKGVTYLVEDLGGEWAELVAMNDSGQVVGNASTPTSDMHAFLWQPGESIIDLGTLGGALSAASAINSAGQVTGSSLTSTMESHAFLWEAGTMRDLGSFGNQTTPASINDAGQVVGTAFTASGAARAVLWEAGTMRDLGTLGGEWGHAMAVSPAGRVVGQSNLTPGDPVNAHAFIWEAGVMQDLGTLGGAWSMPAGRRAVNDAGEVVGSSETALGEVHAFLWQSGTLHDLGTLGVPNTVALGINNAHQVFGYSFRSGGRQHGFFLDPGKCPIGDAPAEGN